LKKYYEVGKTAQYEIVGAINKYFAPSCVDNFEILVQYEMVRHGGIHAADTGN